MDIDNYVKLNPGIYKAFRDFSLEAARKGRTRLSARLVLERIRWETMLYENGHEFKINNNVAPGLARKFMEDYQMVGFFRTRG